MELIVYGELYQFDNNGRFIKLLIKSDFDIIREIEKCHTKRLADIHNHGIYMAKKFGSFYMGYNDYKKFI